MKLAIGVMGSASGQLDEASAAKMMRLGRDEGRLIGVLEGTGGVADHVKQLVALCDKPTGAAVLYDEATIRLVDVADHVLRVAPRREAKLLLRRCGSRARR